MSGITVDTCVIGATAAGVTAAVVLARAGRSVLLTASGRSLGGALPSLGAIETHYAGSRSHVLDEFRDRIVAHYERTYGPGSRQLADCVGLDPENPMTTFEPHVAERVLEELVVEQEGIRVLRRAALETVIVDAGLVVEVVLRQGDERITVRAASFIDATDEGDLVALAGVPTTVGREARSAYDETHAGRIFTRRVAGTFPVDAAEGRLNLIPKRWTTVGPLPGSTGEGDDRVQDYSYRLCLTDDPENRLVVERPEGYDRRDFEAVALPPERTAELRSPLHHRWLTRSIEDMIAEDHIIHGHPLPNRKRSWNATNLTGAGSGYASATPADRARIEARHRDHALGLLYFLQNDEALSPEVRRQAREWGPAADEFVETGGVPEHLYVREARRTVGEVVFTEHDSLLAPGLDRAPVHHRSVAITEFPLDSLPCSPERLPESLPDGQFFLMEETRPGQVPFDVMVTSLGNLLAAVCCSVTHVAWGTIRQTPTQMQMAEAAALACALAREGGIEPADIDIRMLQRRLVGGGSMLSFFNDLDMRSPDPSLAAVQLLGVLGFVRSYDARPGEALTRATASVWAGMLADLREHGVGAVTDAWAHDHAERLPRDEADRADPSVCTARDVRETLGLEVDEASRGHVAIAVARALGLLLV